MMPPKPKKQKVLEFESVYLDCLPNAEMYERSYMHRDTVTHVVVASSDFFITASIDGHIKFWKKQSEGIEFVKHFRSHLGPVDGLSVSFDGSYLASVSRDKSAKVYDVINFDMVAMLRLEFVPSDCEWMYKANEAQLKLAIAAKEENKIYIFDAKSGTTQPIHTIEVAKPVVKMKFNKKYETLLTTDTAGMMDYWSSTTYRFPKGVLSFKHKIDTDLYAMARAKTQACSLELSADGEQIVCFCEDAAVRVWRFRSGKLRRTYDEAVEQAAALQGGESERFKLEAIDFGRRMATERELRKDPEAPRQNAVFDESGNFVIYATLLGIKMVNIVTNRLTRLVGKVENSERFLRVALYQGVPKAKRKRAAPGEGSKAVEKDPTLLCCAFKKPRLYLFSRREPEDVADATVGRDVFNEKPSADELVAVEDVAPVASSNLATGATIHTTLGDIYLKLYPQDCPKTIENFTRHSKNGYYDNLLFHRVIKGFMLQTGDPLGDGTGGSSVWGGEFEDEIVKTLRHDRAGTVSMANAGPNTNGSQFFVTTVVTPWLDGKHTVFGRVAKGMDVVQSIEKVKTDKLDKPLQDVKILNISVEF